MIDENRLKYKKNSYQYSADFCYFRSYNDKNAIYVYSVKEDMVYCLNSCLIIYQSMILLTIKIPDNSRIISSDTHMHRILLYIYIYKYLLLKNVY